MRNRLLVFGTSSQSILSSPRIPFRHSLLPKAGSFSTGTPWHTVGGSKFLSETAIKDLNIWLEAFERKKIDRSWQGCEVRFDASGGKGGQNVNKVATKATLKVLLDKASPEWIPSPLVPTLSRFSPYYAPNSHSLVLSSSSSRTQSDNLEDVFMKLHKHLTETAEELIPTEVDPVKLEKVKRQVQAAKAREKEQQKKSKFMRNKMKGM